MLRVTTHLPFPLGSHRQGQRKGGQHDGVLAGRPDWPPVQHQLVARGLLWACRGRGRDVVCAQQSGCSGCMKLEKRSARRAVRMPYMRSPSSGHVALVHKG